MIRLTSGRFKGRNLKTAPGMSTRPTLSRLRQAWMNAWQTYLPDAIVVDLFAGSGALGFESLSRGAKHVTFVEMDRKALNVIEQNAAILGVEDCVDILSCPAEKAADLISKSPGAVPVDLVFMDPPYRKGWEEKILSTWDWPKILGENGRIGVESWYDKKEPTAFCPPTLEIVRDQRYGETRLTMYALRTISGESALGEQT